MRATAKDLRFRTKELLEFVRRGEEITITYRGKPCAKLVPLSDQEDEGSDNELFGIWRDYEVTKDVADYVRSLRKGRLR